MVNEMRKNTNLYLRALSCEEKRVLAKTFGITEGRGIRPDIDWKLLSGTASVAD